MLDQDAQPAETSKPEDYRQPFSLPKHWYYDRKVYEAEKEGIFGNAWLCAGHVSEFQKPGDFARIDFCDESVLVVCGADNVIRAMYNVCQHRGHQLVSERRGNLRKMIRCPYHSWVYGLDGALRKAAKQESVPGFPVAQLGLPQMKVDFCGQFVFFNADENAAPMAEMYPDLGKTMESDLPDLDRATFLEGDSQALPVNWKSLIDNVVEAYHFALSGPGHKSLAKTVDFDGFYRKKADNWLTYQFPATNEAESTPYPVDLKKVRGRKDGFVVFWMYPDTLIFSMTATGVTCMYRMPPTGPETMYADSAYYIPDERREDAATREAIVWMNTIVNAEDYSLSSSSFRGSKSKGFTRSHLLVNPCNDDSPFSEGPLEMVHRLFHDAADPFL